MSFDTVDFLIIGGGVIGVNLAIQAKRRHRDASVMLIDKEVSHSRHASGRNSGVLHAGFYYTADSLKARFTVDGNKMLSEYCEQHDLPINRCGKLVVTQSESQLDGLKVLYQRGQQNGVELTEISEYEAKQIEPRVKTFEKALWSPTTSSVDPLQVMECLVRQAQRDGVQFRFDTAYKRHKGNRITTNQGDVVAGYVINAAGLYADQIAQDYGFSQHYRIIPFKGLYLIGRKSEDAIRTNIYPVPDLNNPFLGVHFTIAVSGKVKIGPTAIPAFWREHYKGLDNFNLSEMAEILTHEMRLFVSNDFGFRRLAIQELIKYKRATMVKLASHLAHGVRVADFRQRGPAGIRAQLFDTRARKLEMDFKYEGDRHSFHVLNAVSPAFTCSMPFTHYLFEQIDKLLE